MMQQELPARLVLHPGEQKSFLCPPAGVSGYVWQAGIEGAPGVIHAAVQRQAPQKGERLPIGAASPEVLTIHALDPGKATVVLSLSRPWEKGVAPTQTHRISVQVQ